MSEKEVMTSPRSSGDSGPKTGKVTQTRTDWSRLLTGTILIILGVLFLGSEAGYLEFDNFWDLWPFVVVALALCSLLEPDGQRDGGAWIMLTVGLLFVLDRNLDILSIEETWPLILVAGGIALAVDGLRDGRAVSAAKGKS